MEYIGVRRYYFDNLELEATVEIELNNKYSKEKYFVQLICNEDKINDMCEEELFRFFDKEPNLDLVHNILKEMIIYWTLDQINNLSISDIKTPIYKDINNKIHKETQEGLDNLKWGDIVNIDITKLNYKVKDILTEKVSTLPDSDYCITGDTHGDLKFEVFYKAIKEGYKHIFVCGDFGYIWDGGLREQKILDYLSNIGLNIYFVCGNHENFDLLYKYPVIELNGGKAHKIRDNIYHLMRGEVFTFENKKIFTFGRASSIDKDSRVEGISWWNQEVPSKEEKDNARINLAKHNNKINYIITHTGHNKVLEDMPGNYRLDEVSNFLDKLYSSIEFDWWYHGHMHINHLYEKGKTTCINKSILKISL